MRYMELLAQYIDAKSKNDGRAMTCAELKLESCVSKLHSTFWSQSRIEKWERAFGVKPNVPRLDDRECSAVFPVVENDDSANALYRISLTANGTDSHSFKYIFADGVEERLLAILKYVRLEVGVDINVTLEPEFEEIKHLLSEEPIGGRSMELALYIAASTFKMGRPFRPASDERYVFTGRVEYGGIRSIEGLAEKAECVARWRPESILVSPIQERSKDLRNVKGCSTVSMLKEVLRGPSNSWKRTFEKFANEHEHQEIVTMSLPIQDELQRLPIETDSELSKTRYKLRILLGVVSAYNHLGRASEALHLVRCLKEFLKEPVAQSVMCRFLNDGEDWQFLMAVSAVSFLDDFQLEEGLELFEVPLESAFSDRYRIHYQGSKASLLMAMGDLSNALALYENNLHISDTTTLEAKGEMVRTYCYYGNVLRLMQRYEDAEKAFKHGLELSEEDPDLYDISDSGHWIRWQYAKLMHDQKRKTSEIEELIESIPDWMKWGLQLSYPKTQVDIEEGKKALSKAHPECRLYQSAILRAKAQLHLHNGEEIPDDLLADLRGLHHTWADLEYAELWKRIPY